MFSLFNSRAYLLPLEFSKVYSPYYLKKAGLLLEQNGESSDAVELYQTILDKYYYEDIIEFRKVVRWNFSFDFFVDTYTKFTS